MFGEGPDFDPRTWLNPEFFQLFIRDMKEGRENSQSGSALEDITIDRL